MGYSDKTGPEGELTLCLTLGTGRHRSRDVVEDGEGRDWVGTVWSASSGCHRRKWRFNWVRFSKRWVDLHRPQSSRGSGSMVVETKSRERWEGVVGVDSTERARASQVKAQPAELVVLLATYRSSPSGL